MLHLSPPYRIDEGLNNWENVSVLTVLHAFFGFIEFFFGFSVFRFWMIFSTMLRFLIGPNAPLSISSLPKTWEVD